MPNGRCRLHGGKSYPAGPSHPTYKHGRYSSVIPANLVDVYDRSRISASILDLSDEIGLIDSMVADALSAAASGGSAENWRTLKKLFADRDLAAQQKDAAGLLDATDAMRAIVAAENSALSAQDRAVSLIERRRRIVDTERRRLVDAQMMITSEQGMLIIDRLWQLVIENVNDRGALARIATGVREISTGSVRRSD